MEASNETLVALLQSLKGTMDDAHKRTDEQLVTIDTKVTQINGRVRKLEYFKFMAIGALIILNLIAVPLIVRFLEQRIFG